MAQKHQTYTMGYGKEATSSHASRNPESDAAFLLPYLKADHHILDLGCGPGTITTGFCSYVPKGFVTGIDISPHVLSQAADLATARPEGRPTNLEFFAVNVLKPGWAETKPDKNAQEPSAVPKSWINHFDVVFESQCFVHIPDPVGAMKKLLPCVKKGGLFALRDYDAATFIFNPDPSGKLKRWGELQSTLVVAQGAPSDYGGRDLYRYAREAGIPPEKIEVSSNGIIYLGPERRKWWGGLLAERLGQGKGQRKTLEKCGITTEEIDEIQVALLKWIDEPDGLFSATAFQVIAHV